jgi:hypothetical protein
MVVTLWKKSASPPQTFNQLGWSLLLLFSFPDRFPRAWHIQSRDTAHRANQTAESDCAIGERRDKALIQELTFIFFHTTD